MLTDKIVGFIGVGNMATALIKGMVEADVIAPESIIASDVRPKQLEKVASKYGIVISPDNRDVASRSDIVVLAVKPQIMDRVLDEVSESLTNEKLVVSIAAGVPIESIEKKLHREMRVIRVMPNTPAIVSAGATALAPGLHATEQDLEMAKKIFEAVSMTFVLDESLMDAVTGLSGSGPAYIFLIIEALSDAGVKVGLPRYVAQDLAAQTVLGSAKLLIETGEHPGVLKDMVTSPGGTAIAGLHTLEEGGLRTTLINAVEQATNRSKALGEEMKKKP